MDEKEEEEERSESGNCSHTQIKISTEYAKILCDNLFKNLLKYGY